MTRRLTPSERARNTLRAMPSPFARAIAESTRRTVIADRMLGGGVSAAVTGTFMFLRRAPAEFDAVQFILRGTAKSATNQFKVSVCSPAQRGNGYVPLDASGAQMAKTPVTFGTTDRNDFGNPGGGTAYAILNNSKGDGSTFDLLENDVASDWIFLSSSDRSDTPGAPPLLMFNIYGIAPPAMSWAESVAGVNNSIASTVDPDFYSGYWQNADHTATADPGTGPTQWGMPIVEVRYLLRGGKMGYSLAFGGDSIDQGWVPAATVPQFGANMNSWGRRLCGMLTAAGTPAGYMDLSIAGQRSQMFHNRIYNAINGRHCTHAFFKPWSVNEVPDGVASIAPALARTSRLIELARLRGVTPVIVHPWGGQGLDTQAWARDPINAYMANIAAAGVPVLDIRGVMNTGGALNGTMRDEFRPRNSGGGFIDGIHPNEPGHIAIAREAFARRAQFGLL